MLHAIPADRREGLSLGDESGLTSAEASTRLHRFGLNDIVGKSSTGWRDVLRDTVGDPMIWFLVGTAIVFAVLGDFVEAAILAIALVPIIGMDMYLHRRTQASTEGLAGRLASIARVVRDGSARDIPAAQIVPGDLVIVQESQSFPADGIVLAGENLQVDESSLTGEALPVRKRPILTSAFREVIGEAGIESEHWGAAGTRLLTGEAQLRVVLTGRETLYGEIVRSAQSGTHERTPLQQALSSLVAALLVTAVVMCLALAATRYYQGHGWLDALLSAVTLAVAALPEEFPVVFTFFLSVGVLRLARRQALVRRAVVVENIGRVTCICSDKTGTLTEGRLRLMQVQPLQGTSNVTLLHAAAIASRERSADPMDLAVLEAASELNDERVATFPFTEDRRREVGIVRERSGAYLASAKGAPETIIAMTTLSAEERAVWLGKTDEWAAEGYKVIACAQLRVPQWSGGEPDHGYDFLGLLAFRDPLRASAAEAVKQAQAAGIRVIMVTGDHPATARAIAAEAGIGAGAPRVVEGSDLQAYLHTSEPTMLEQFDVLARMVPAQKLDLVRALQASGEIVAVTGDGVNDVPALQGADIGIAMGERGTRSAREIASIVLLDDNFRTIIRAIAEGRQLFDNLKLSFAYLLMVHIPLVLTAALVPFAGFPLLYLPAHIVWLELIIHPTALLVFQQLPSSDELAPVRRSQKLRFFDAKEWTVVCVVGFAITTAIALGYIRSLGPEADVEHARSMAMISLIVASATVTTGLTRLRTRASLITVIATLLSAIVFVQIPALAALIHLSPLHADDWLIAASAGVIPGALATLISLPRRARRAPSSRLRRP